MTGIRYCNYTLGYITLNKGVDEMTLVMKGHVWGRVSAVLFCRCHLGCQAYLAKTSTTCRFCFNKNVLTLSPYFFSCTTSAWHASVTS